MNQQSALIEYVYLSSMNECGLTTTLIPSSTGTEEGRPGKLGVSVDVASSESPGW